MTMEYYLGSYIKDVVDYLMKVLLLFCYIFCILLAAIKIQENNRELQILNNIHSERTLNKENLNKIWIKENEIVYLDVLEQNTRQISIENAEINEFSKQEILESKVEKNYIPTEEEREFAYKIAFAEAGVEDSIGQTLVINVAINNMKQKGLNNLLEEFLAKGRYNCVKEGEVYNSNAVVNIIDVPDSVKQAVELAFNYDYSEEILKQQASKLGIEDSKYWENGATYFYNPEYCSEKQKIAREKIKVKFKYGNHIFYKYWDK